MTRGQLDEYAERSVFVLILGIVVYAPLALGSVRPLDFLVIQALCALGLVVWSVRFLINDKLRLLFPPVCWAILAFLGLAWFRYLEADLEYVARYECLKIVVYATLFLLALNNLQREENIQWLVLILTGLATVIAFYAIYQFFNHSEYVWHFLKPAKYVQRGSGTYICPNHLAGFLELVLPLAVAVLFAGRYHHVFKIFLGYCCLVILAGIAVTLSRGGWIATAVTLFVLFLFLVNKRHFRVPATVALVLLTFAAAVTYQQSDKLQKRLQVIDQIKSDPRPEIWRASLRMWQNHRLWGVGPGHFDYRFAQYRPRTIQERPGRVHNDYLNTLVDWGLAGSLIAGLGGVLLLTGMWRSRKYLVRDARDLGQRRNSNRAAFLLGSLGTVTAMGVHSLFDYNLHVPANATIAVVVLALGASHIRFATKQYWISNWPGARWIYATLGFAVAGLLLVTGMRTAREQWILAPAHWLDATQTTERLDRMKRAAQLEPGNFENLYRIGELLRTASFNSPAQSDTYLTEAVQWFEAAARIHPEFAFNYVGIGMALDRLNRVEEATPQFEAAMSLDPNNHQVNTFMGWHQINRGDFPSARDHFQRSLEIKWWDNHVPQRYLNRIAELEQDALETNLSP